MKQNVVKKTGTGIAKEHGKAKSAASEARTAPAKVRKPKLGETKSGSEMLRAEKPRSQTPVQASETKVSTDVAPVAEVHSAYDRGVSPSAEGARKRTGLDLRDRIERKAYELYLARQGTGNGSAEEDWLLAEKACRDELELPEALLK